jgi:hypothetical protein
MNEDFAKILSLSDPWAKNCLRNKNCKVDNFNSKFWVPGTNGVGAFAFDWWSDSNWIVPPVSLVCKAINHMFL